MVFLGDYIDRGPDSAGVIELLLKFAEQHPYTVFLRGNHEQMFLDFISDRDPLPFLANGGDLTLASYQKRDLWPIPRRHLKFFEPLRDFFETPEFIFVHAGLRPGIPLVEQNPDDLLWIRDAFLSSPADWGKTVVFGHTPHHQPLMTDGRIGLDTGCVYGRRLTCCDVHSKQMWSV